MAKDDLKADLLQLFGDDDSAMPTSTHEIVEIFIDDDEMEDPLADPEGLPETIKAVLNNHAAKIRHLCMYFVEVDSRLTLDDDSFEVQWVDLDSRNVGTAECPFTVSVYYGCRDMNLSGDERECSIPLEVNLAARRITLKVLKIERRDTREEF